jgi:sigma-B regulation protein RsbU (phosphoserine phosphatase)
MWKRIIQPRTLQQRTLFFILIPTFILLVGLSVGGYIFVRNILLNQWGETAITKLQRTAHQIDMRMRKPKDLLQLLQDTESAGLNSQVFDYVLKKIETLDGVAAVNVEWLQENPVSDTPSNSKMMAMMNPNLYKLDRFELSLPKYDSRIDNRTVSLVTELRSRDDITLAIIKIQPKQIGKSV